MSLHAIALALGASLPLLPAAAAAPPSAPPERVRHYIVAAFERLRVEGPYTVELVAGAPRAEAEGDVAALDRLAIRVDAGTLIVSGGVPSWDARHATAGGGAKVRVRLATPALRAVRVAGNAVVRVTRLEGADTSVSLAGDGRVAISGIDAQTIAATLSGGGAIALAGRAMRARITNAGSGTVDAGALAIGEARLATQDRGGIRATVRYRAQLIAGGAGVIEVLGTPECRISGPGPVRCDGPGGRRD